jgi:hypothetical protein
MSFLQELQYLLKATSSHSQKGASPRSESSGVGSRVRRGVGGGVGSPQCCEVPFLFVTLSSFVSKDTGTITTALVLLDSGLASLSRDDAKASLGLLVDDAAKLGLCDLPRF